MAAKKRSMKNLEDRKSCFEDTTCASNFRSGGFRKRFSFSVRARIEFSLNRAVFSNAFCYAIGQDFITVGEKLFCFANKFQLFNRNSHATRVNHELSSVVIYWTLIMIYAASPNLERQFNVFPSHYSSSPSREKVRNHNLSSAFSFTDSAFMPFLIKIKLFRSI